MRVVVVHNFYQQPGGEDEVFRAEVALLRAHGHDVSTFLVHNDAVASMSKPALMKATLWNNAAAKELAEQVTRERAEIVHFHNTFPLISPAAYAAARRAGAAVVQSLHNYRLVCPGSLLLRDGTACTKCVGKTFALPGVIHGCYRGSRPTTAITAAMLTLHRFAGTWRSSVDQYIALTESGRGHFIKGGLPAERISVKPHFVDPDPGIRDGGGRYVLFVGRLSHEKGVETLLEAWENNPIPLVIVGDGPLAPKVQALQARNPSVRWLGRRPAAEIPELAGRAALLVLPSICFETFGRVAVEAFAVGTPVIGSGHGAVRDVVGEDGSVGDLFEPGNAADLRGKVAALFATPDRLRQMRPVARAMFQAHYGASSNYTQLMAIYERALSRRWPERATTAALEAALSVLYEVPAAAEAIK